jgi:Lhr-like helicase
MVGKAKIAAASRFDSPVLPASLQAIDGRLPPTTQVMYVSPLKALSNDVQKSLDGPLAEIQKLAMGRG